MLLTPDGIMSLTALITLKDKFLTTTSNPNWCPVELQAWAVRAIQFTLQISLALIAHSLPSCKV